MDASLYQPIFLLSVTILAVMMASKLRTEDTEYGIEKDESGKVTAFLISIIFIFWIGNRPISGRYFGDTANYALDYSLNDYTFSSIDWHAEWVWSLFLYVCQKIHLDIHAVFTLVEAGYILSILWAVVKLTPRNVMLTMIFVFASLSFFTFGVNGLRNGLACHFICLGLAFLLEGNYLAGVLIYLAAFGIHRSSMLPIASSIVGILVWKKPEFAKYAFYFWASSILVSLVAGGAVTNFFSSLGFDDRMSSYSTAEVDDTFSHSGFRWDLLLYSAMPVAMSWYVIFKRNVSDNWYNVLTITYLLCNAFWIMVVRASYSNRFAYLSWFLYPLMIAYPLSNLQVWEDQPQKTSVILYAYTGFTLFMMLIYW